MANIPQWTGRSRKPIQSQPHLAKRSVATQTDERGYAIKVPVSDAVRAHQIPG
jgi:hypothetical protein